MTSVDKRNVRMDAHSVEPAIVLRYSDGKGNGEEQLKIIQLKSLNEHSNATTIARFVLDQCHPLIQISRIDELAKLVNYLQKRAASDRRATPTAIDSKVSLQNLDEYIEMLYEEGESKQRGISLLSELVLNLASTDLPEIVKNDQLMGALARTLKEDARRNFDLAIQLVELFHRLSQFIDFHPLLAHWKIGLVSLQIVEQELRRWEQWRQQMLGLTDKQAKKKWEFAMRKQDQLITVCIRILLNLADDIRTESKMLRKGLLPLLFKSLEHSTSPQLLLATVKFLWKLSLFAENQRYIANTPGTVEQLVSFLPSSTGHRSAKASSTEFRSALFSLLFNCSFELTSRRRMVQAGLVSLLAPLLQGSDIAIALMYQLTTVDDDAKAMIAFTDCIPTLLESLFHGSASVVPSLLLTNEEEQQRQLEKRDHLLKSILMNVVLEKRNAQLLCGTDGQGLDALMAYALDGEHGDLMALKILRNVATHEGPTREMFGKWLSQLLENALEKINPRQSNSPDHIFGLECLAICAIIPEAAWLQLDNQHGIVDFLAKLLGEVEHLQTPGDDVERKHKKRTKDVSGVTDDLLLQAIMFSGTLAAHSAEMAERVERHLLPLIVATLNKRQEDDELVLQCAFAFACLLSHGGQLAARLCSHQHHKTDGNDHSHNVVELLLNLMHDKNPRLRALCDQQLGQIAENSPYWRTRIQEAKFRWHNAQWIEMVKAPDDHHLLNNNLYFDETVMVEQVLDSEELLKGTDF